MLVGAILWLPISATFVLLFLVWNTVAMGMVAMLWSWNISGVFLPSLSP